MFFTKNKYLLTGILGAIGFLDAAYLTILHYQNVIPPCTLKGCEKVLTSQFSIIHGIPLSLIGIAFYLTVITLSLLNNFKHNFILQRLLKITASIGFSISILLLIDQLFVVHAICQYCLISLFTSTLIFLVSFGIKDKKEENVETKT